MQNNNRLMIGVTGSIASGKSSFCRILKEYGFESINSDEIVSELYQKDGTAYRAIVALGIDNLKKENGEIDKENLRKLIFNDPVMKQKIEALVHPLVLEEINSRVQKSIKTKFVIEVPLLFEAKLEKIFNLIVSVFAEKETIIKNTEKKYNITRLEAEKILSSQMDIEEKMKKSDFVIMNTGTIEDLRVKALELLEKLACFI
jgi:dephospho-CoA kinase